MEINMKVFSEYTLKMAARAYVPQDQQQSITKIYDKNVDLSIIDAPITKPHIALTILENLNTTGANLRGAEQHLKNVNMFTGVSTVALLGASGAVCGCLLAFGPAALATCAALIFFGVAAGLVVFCIQKHTSASMKVCTSQKAFGEAMIALEANVTNSEIKHLRNAFGNKAMMECLDKGNNIVAKITLRAKSNDDMVAQK